MNISCTANKKGMDKIEKQTDQLVYFYRGMLNYFADELAVFGWNGNIVEACRLDQSICNLEIDGMKIFI